MNEALVRRVKNSLNAQNYTMNDSWLSDCIEYYLNDNANASQQEIITFVMSQWVLYDLREINNENGCLPKNLAQIKCTSLPGKYILQMDKMYDISQSKYKQLEKIRNVSSENVEATENENANQEDKFQNYEPKSKRMLQLFLTDGVQDVLAIEYKPIRFLKSNLYPGFKVMIKGPVVCRKGVILLEETNISEVGGEVDSLLIVNAVENVLARALNLEENPDPYNDNNKQNQNSQSTQSTHRTEEIDDFDMDSEMLEQIDKQVQQQNSTHNSENSSIKNKANPVNNKNSVQNQNIGSVTSYSKTGNNIKNSKNITRTSHFEDDDAFFELVDDKAFENVSTPKFVFAVPQSIPSKQSTSKIISKPNIEDFPMDDEEYDLATPNKKSTSSKTISTPQVDDFPFDDEMYDLPTSNKKSTPSSTISKSKTTIESSTYQKSTLNGTCNKNKNSLQEQQHKEVFDIPNDDFDFSDVNMEEDDFTYTDKNNKLGASDVKPSQSSLSSLNKITTSVKCESNQSESNKTSVNSSSDTKCNSSNSVQRLGSEFEDEYDIDFEAVPCMNYTSAFKQKMEVPQTSKTETIEKTSLKYENLACNSTDIIRAKRSGSTMSPTEEIPQKVRCLQSTPKANKTNERKITDFITNKSPSPLLVENGIKVYELLKDVLRQPATSEPKISIVRGKVTKIVKLNLLKSEKGPYFHLEGTITDNTANLDVVFSSKVLEKIIGYSSQEFSQKRKQSKTDPSIKDQLREDLKKAQQTLTVMDELMEIERKKGEKALVVNSVKLTKEEKKKIDDRIKLL